MINSVCSNPAKPIKDMLQEQLRLARIRAAALPEWRRQQLAGAHEAEVRLGYIRQPQLVGEER